MGYLLIVTVLLVLMGVAALLFSGPDGVPTGAIVALGLILILGFTAFKSFKVVDNGHIGMVKRFGVLQQDPKEAGVATIAPWESLDEVSVKNERRDYDMTGGNSAVSSDSQDVFLKVSINYRLDRAQATELYQQTGGDFENRILDPAVLQNTKAVTARFKATEFAENRDKIRREIEDAISSEVSDEGLEILNVSLNNVGFTDGLSRAIEQTVEARQQAERAEAQVRIKEAEARQLIAEARGQARSQQLRQRTLTPLLVRMAAIEKLNPNVQLIICPPRTVCVPNDLPVTATPKEGE